MSENQKPRSLYWLLLPFFLSIIGSIVLHYLLRQDSKNNRGIIVGINKFNWLLGLILVPLLIVEFWSFFDFGLFALIHDCIFLYSDTYGREMIYCSVDP